MCAEIYFGLFIMIDGSDTVNSDRWQFDFKWKTFKGVFENKSKLSKIQSN